MHSNDEGSSRENDGISRLSRDTSRLSPASAVAALSDADLLASTQRLVCQSNRVFAALLAHLAEVEARGLHRTRACATLYTYCIYELRMSEDAAYRRVAAARLVKRFPLLCEAVERGELHLTGLLLLGPHLTDANLVEVLARAKFRTKKELLKLVRLLSPVPDVPSRIEPLGLEQRRLVPRASWANVMAARCPVRELQPHERPASWLPPSEELEFPALDPSAEPALARNDATVPDRPPSASPAPAPARLEQPAATLDGPQRFKVQFTASEEYVALVEEAKSLLSHARPNADLAELHLHAVRALVAQLKKRKYAMPVRRTETPAASSTPTPSPDDPSTPRLPSSNPPSLDDPSAPRLGPSNATPTNASGSRDDPSARRVDSVQSSRRRGRNVPAAVRRSVVERDGGRCAYVDARGVRCRETSRLELHHHAPFARGGQHTPANLSLRCTAHNALAAEQDFGRDFCAEQREHPHLTERSVSQADRLPTPPT